VEKKGGGSAWARWLRTALTAAGGTRLVGAAEAGYEQGRAAGRGRRGAGVTNRRDRGEGGPVAVAGVREKERERGRAVVGRRHVGPSGTMLGSAVQI
jgi:hypothetical protein